VIATGPEKLLFSDDLSVIFGVSLMKIAHLTSVHHARDTRILYKECASLAQAGYKVYLVAYGDSFKESGVQVVGLGKKPTNRFQRIWGGAKQVVERGLALDCQIYHLHDPELLPFIPRLQKAGKKVIFDSHEDVPQQLLEKEWLPARRLVSRLYTKVEKHYLRRTDAVIGVTPHLVERLQTINPNVVMVTNYPVLDAFYNEKDPAALNSKGAYLCFVGRISPDWNHLLIVQALQKMEGVYYVLCGKPDSRDYLESLLQADRKGILDYRGVINHTEVPALYTSALAGVSWLMPTPNSGWKLGTLGNNKLFEQMAAGIPVIISDMTLWMDIIHRYDCGLVVPSGDVQELRDAVQGLLDDPERACEMGKNGRRAVEEEFNWTEQSKVLLKMYRDLIEGEEC
jgi:glycosyltransferase involved in cell wall biosynthesis